MLLWSCYCRVVVLCVMCLFNECVAMLFSCCVDVLLRCYGVVAFVVVLHCRIVVLCVCYMFAVLSRCLVVLV